MVLQSCHQNPRWAPTYIKLHWLPKVRFFMSYLSGAASPVKSKMASMRLQNSATPRFLPEWRQDVPGPERVLGGSQRAPGREALGGLPDQAHSSSLAITACTERRRLPTPAGQPRGDDAYFFAAGHMNYARYMTWYLRNVENLPTAAKNDLMKGAQIYIYIVTQTAGRECQPTNSENKHRSGEGMVQAGWGASPQMLSKSQFGSTALAYVSTFIWP